VLAALAFRPVYAAAVMPNMPLFLKAATHPRSSRP
jgi:hypothetical protein